MREISRVLPVQHRRKVQANPAPTQGTGDDQSREHPQSRLLEFAQPTRLMHPKQATEISNVEGVDVWRQERG